MRRLLPVLVVVVGLLAALGGQARADFTPSEVMPISTTACPGFAPDYPSFPDPIFDRGSMDPAGPYVFVSWNDVSEMLVAGGATAKQSSWVVKVNGTDPFADFHVFGVAHGTGPFPRGEGEMQVVRGDGARMWGKAMVFFEGPFGGGWLFAWEPATTHCSQ